MAKTITRKISIFINGKEVKNNLNSVGKEIGKLRGQIRNLTPGTDKFIKKSQELKKARKAYADINKEIRGTQSLLSKIKKGAGSIGFPVAGALLFTDALKSGVQWAKEFITDSVQMAEEARGVEFAFEQLGIVGEDAFKKVKEATKGLLSDLEIKKSLVEFDNFNISLEESATLFEFLTIRATQTGISVDKLKQSLVEGLSKESKLRIDNLGISAKQLNEELKKTPNFVQAVSNIAKTEIVRAGNILDEATSSTQKWNATLENAQVRLGKLIVNSGAVSFFQKLAGAVLNAVVPMEDLTTAVKEEQLDLNILVQRITDVNISNKDRKKYLEQLKTSYPGYLKNLDTEKTTNKELTERLKEVNKGYIAKITLLELSQDVEKLAIDSSDKQRIAFDLEERAREKLNNTIGFSETNRLLENLSIKEAIDLALTENGVTEESIKINRKLERQGTTLFNAKQKALIEVQHLLENSNLFESKSNDLRDKANESQGKLNRFTEKYAEILKQVDGITDKNTPTSSGGGGGATAAEIKAEEDRIKKIAALAKAAAANKKRAHENLLKEIQKLEENALLAKQDLDTQEIQKIVNKYDKLLEVAEEGSVEEAALMKLRKEEIFAKELELEEKFQIEKEKVRQQYDVLSNADLQATDIANLQQAYNNKLLTHEEFEIAKLKIEEFYKLKKQEEALTEEEAKAEKDAEDYALQLEQEALTDEERFTLELARLDDLLARKKISEDEYDKYVAALKEKSLKKSLQESMVAVQAVSNFINAAKQRELDGIKEVERRKGESEESFLKRKEAVEKKKKEIRRKYAFSEMLTSIAQIGIATALGMMNAIAQMGPIAGGIAAGAIGALGIVQTADAMSEYKKAQSYATGGYTGVGDAGMGRNDGGYIQKVVEEDEYVIPSIIASDPSYQPAIQFLEKARTDTFNEDNSLPFADEGQTAGNDNTALIAVLSQLNATLQSPIIATALIGDDEIARQKIRQEKLDNTRTNAKIK